MINWQSVIFNSFWILGAAIILAAFSYNYWAAGQENRRMRLQLGEPGFQKPFWLGIAFIAVGVTGTSQELWEMVLWGVLTLVAIVIFISLYR